MGLFGRLLNGSNRPPAVSPQAPAGRTLVQGEEEPGNPELIAAIDRLENPKPDFRRQAAERTVMRAFDDEESCRRMVAAIRRLLHEGKPARGGSDE